MVRKTVRQLRRVFVAIVGFTIVLMGVAMVVTPGPATLVIPLGLGILATEFVWARRLIDRAKAILSRRKEGRSDGTEAERKGG